MLYSVLLPTYNERTNLPIVVTLLADEFQTNSLSLEIIIVDDSSPDGTFQIAQQLVPLFPQVKFVLLKREEKLGLASAYNYASKHATGDFVIIMDADLSHHPKYINKMIQLMHKHSYDIVTGTRYSTSLFNSTPSSSSSNGVVGWSLMRKVTSTIANTLASWLLDLPSNSSPDLTGSFRLFKREIFCQLISESITNGYTFQMECLVRAEHKGIRIGQLPIVFVDRMFGHSKLDQKEIFNFVGGLVKMMVSPLN